MATHHRDRCHALRTSCSNHANRRMQQRCISLRGVDAVISYGEEHRTQSGFIYFLGKRECRRLRRTLSPAQAREIEQYRDYYVIAGDDGTIVTVGHRTRRIRR